jgi:hypothetical protein
VGEFVMTAPIAASAFASLIAVAALVFASAASAEVYKCKQAGGGVAYQDYACKGGTIVDVRAGSADPAAVDRLERANAAFDRAAAARKANEEVAAIRRAALNERQRELEAAQNMAEAAANSAPIYAPVYAVPVLVPKHRRDSHRRNEHPAVTARHGPARPPRSHLQARTL